MTQTIKISELPAATALSGAETVALVQAGQTRRTTTGDLRAGLAAAAHTHAASDISDASSAGRTLLTAASTAAQRTALGLGTLAQQAAGSVAITGGSINATSIGLSTPAAGQFTSLTVSGPITGQAGYVATADASSVALYLRGRSDNIGAMIFQNNAGNSTLAAITSWPGSLRVEAGGGERLRLVATAVQFQVPACPITDQGCDLGTAAARWKDIYASNAVIQVSDERAKTDIADTPLGLDFILALRPVRYRFRDADIPAVTQVRSVERPVTTPVRREREEVRRIDGLYRLMRVEEVVEEPVMQDVPLHDADGAPLYDADGQPRLYRVPVMEAVEDVETLTPAHSLRHTRPHDGLIAQQVKAVLDARGLDMAGFIHDPQTDSYGLRYAEFIAPLIRAVQELAQRVQTPHG